MPATHLKTMSKRINKKTNKVTHTSAQTLKYLECATGYEKITTING
jgi:hypothetical protein